MDTILLTGTIPHPVKLGETYQVSFIGERTSPTMISHAQEIIDRGGVYDIKILKGGN